MSLTNTPLSLGKVPSVHSGISILGDSPSPVDLLAPAEPDPGTSDSTMLPPETPSSLLNLSKAGSTNNSNKRLRPLTPAGIMNLGHLLDTPSTYEQTWLDVTYPQMEMDRDEKIVGSLTASGIDSEASVDQIPDPVKAPTPPSGGSSSQHVFCLYMFRN